MFKAGQLLLLKLVCQLPVTWASFLLILGFLDMFFLELELSCSFLDTVYRRIDCVRLLGYIQCTMRPLRGNAALKTDNVKWITFLCSPRRQQIAAFLQWHGLTERKGKGTSFGQVYCEMAHTEFEPTHCCTLTLTLTFDLSILSTRRLRVWSRIANSDVTLSLIHIWRCRRSTLCRSRWSPYH